MRRLSVPLICLALFGCFRPPAQFRSFAFPRELFDGHHEEDLRSALALNWTALFRDGQAAALLKVRTAEGGRDGRWLAAQSLALVRFTDGAVRRPDGSFSPGCVGSLLQNRFGFVETMRSLRPDLLIAEIDFAENPDWTWNISPVTPLFFVVRSGRVDPTTVAGTPPGEFKAPDTEPFFTYAGRMIALRKPGRRMAHRRPLAAEEQRAGEAIATAILKRLGF